VLKDLEFHGIVGKSPAMLEVLTSRARWPPLHQCLAHRGHWYGQRAGGPRHSPDQSGQPAKIGRMQLFGAGRHLAGEPAFRAYARVIHRRHRYSAGTIRVCEQRDVFLDEVGETSLPMQAKLLRVIQNREIQRVGSPEVRQIKRAADRGHQPDLRAEVLAGRSAKIYITG